MSTETTQEAALGRHVLEIIRNVDEWLDDAVAGAYQDQPLGQDWARVAKVAEEVGEAIAELILATGQNPRKGHDPAARERLLAELADVAVTGMFAIQHFTKDENETASVLMRALNKAGMRAADAGYGPMPCPGPGPCVNGPDAHRWQLSCQKDRD